MRRADEPGRVVVTGVNRCARHAAVPVNETVTVVAYYKYYR